MREKIKKSREKVEKKREKLKVKGKNKWYRKNSNDIE